MPSEIFWLLFGVPSATLPEPPPAPDEAVEIAAEKKAERAADATPPEPLVPEATTGPAGRDRLGVYGRFSLGPSYLWGRYEGPTGGLGAPVRQVTIEGPAASFETVIGGAPAPGFFLGARIALLASPPVGWVARDTSGETGDLDAFAVFQGGFFVDWYLVPDGGFHVFASSGLAMLPDPTPLFSDLQSGVAWSGGLGYDLWLGEHWSSGITLRVDGAHLGPDTVGEGTFLFACPSAQLSFTVN